MRFFPFFDVRFERGAQVKASAAKERLHRFRRQLHYVGDFLIAHPFESRQQERFALARAERIDGGADDRLQFESGDAAGRGRAALREEVFFDDEPERRRGAVAGRGAEKKLGTSAFRSQRIKSDVVRDAVKPSRETRFRAVRVAMFVNPHKDFLR